MVVRYRLGSNQHSIYLNADGTPKTVVRAQETKSGKAKFGATSERSKELLEKLWTYYEQDGTVFAAINRIAFNATMVGYTLRSENPKAIELIEPFCRKIDLDTNNYIALRNALVYGDSFTEKILNKGKEISRLKDIDPKTMWITDDKYGDIKEFYQIIENKRMPPLKPEKIAHLKLFDKPGTPYGLSIIEPSMDNINNAIEAHESLFSAFKRHGTIKHVATIGTDKDGELPPDEIMEDVETKLEDISSKTDFVLPWNCKIEAIDEKGVQGIEEYYNYFLSLEVLGLLIPEEAMGIGRGSTEATASVKAVMFERVIKAFQKRLSRMTELEYFNPILENNGFDLEEPKNSVEIVYNSVTDEDEALKAKWIGNILHGFQHSLIKPFTINEVRGFLGLKAINLPEANKIIFTKEELGERGASNE